MTVDILKAKLDELLKEKDISSQAVKCRELLSDCITYVYESVGVSIAPKATMMELLANPMLYDYGMDDECLAGLNYVRRLGLNAQHDKAIKKKEIELAVENITGFVNFLSENPLQKGKAVYKKLPYMSEAETRKLYIDLYLKEAGWEVLENKNVIQPAKAGIEIEVEGMPNTHNVGYCDYVLYGKDGKPLAIIEAKKTSVDISVGRHQVELYGDAMEKKYGYRPILYLSNGYDTRIIDGIYPERKLLAFHNLKDLELMIQRRNRGNITDLKVNEDITNRPYQKMAITSMCERLNAKRRRGLIVMATGTGKTRVAISLVELLSRKENNWVRNVLFLADRTSLVRQAKHNFEKLLPSMTVCELSGDSEKDYNALMMFSTYQTMIHYIDAEDKRFSPGRFDLIIIDEAHRSVFNRYGSIFKYFDSLLIGLTATPKGEVGHSTYDLLECEQDMPTFDYSMESAIEEKYLVGYQVINKSTKLMTDGIKYKDLTAEQRDQLDDYFMDNIVYDTAYENAVIPASDIFKYLYNIDTCKKVIEDLMTNGLRVNDGETLGKTIIFAYNHKHAEMIVECFKKLYPEYPNNTCQLVDYSVKYAEDLVLKFESDDEFRIAVSVDMLDTGIDIPAILNLVFFKPVKSLIKFIQMIGRGTRLCENLYGYGKNKTGFLIFDYCGNFDFFDVNPTGNISNSEGRSTTQRIFDVKLDMLYELQNYRHQQDDYLKGYYENIKKELHNEVVVVKSHSERIQVREELKYVDEFYNKDKWVSLSAVDIKEVKNHITKLIDSGLKGDRKAISCDLLMFRIELSILSAGDVSRANREVQFIRAASQYLMIEKASIPQVFDKIDVLKTIVTEQFWMNTSVDKIEQKREEIRDLMKFITDDRKPIEIDIPDTPIEKDWQPGTLIDIRTYREKVIDYLTENSDNPVIQKIKNLEPITNADLNELEHILWEELGTKEDYEKSTSIVNLAAFVRSLIGLDQEVVNEKFGQYLQGNSFNSLQQEFVKTIINYVRVNGDVELSDMVNTEPFSEYDLSELFGEDVNTIVYIVNTLHNSIVAA